MSRRPTSPPRWLLSTACSRPGRCCTSATTVASTGRASIPRTATSPNATSRSCPMSACKQHWPRMSSASESSARRSGCSVTPASASFPTTSARLTALMLAPLATAEATAGLPGSLLSSARSADASRTTLLTLRFESTFGEQLRAQRTALGHELSDQLLCSSDGLTRSHEVQLASRESQEHVITNVEPKGGSQRGGDDNAAAFANLRTHLHEVVDLDGARFLACRSRAINNVPRELVLDVERPRDIADAQPFSMERTNFFGLAVLRINDAKGPGRAV